MSFAEFHFLRPWWLLALMPVMLLVTLLIRNKLARGDWSEVCDPELLPFILQEKPLKATRGGPIGGALVACLTIVALAGPTWQRLPSPAFRNDSALVIALDLSRSMNATDIKPSRLNRARYKIADILKQRKDGQTALLVYSGDVFTVTPLTTDVATINSQLEALTTDIMPSPGSNAALAIQKAVELLQQASLTQGHILLVTDGTDDDSIEHASDLVGNYQLSILGVGTAEGAPIPVTGGGFLKDKEGNIVVARLDLAALTTLAANGHGKFQPVTADDDDISTLSALFGRSDPAQSRQESALLLQQWDEKGPWLLLLVLPWAALRFRKGLLTFALLCLLPLPRDAQAWDWQSLWQTTDQQARQAFEQQQFDQAADTFSNPDWRAAAQYRAGHYQEAAETLKNTQTADGHYNRGNALAKAGQLQEALQAYQQALKLDPNHADAKYNKELVEKQLADQKQQQQQSQDQQQSSEQQSQEQKPQDKPADHGDHQDSQQDQQQQKDDASQQQAPDQQKQSPEQDQPQKNEPDQKQDDANGKQDASEAKPDEPKDQPAEATRSEKPDSETERANQQLLKRIPDEPTGLLKRKFKYQYGQRKRPDVSRDDW